MNHIRSALQLHDSIKQYINWAFEHVFPRSESEPEKEIVSLDLKRIQLEVHFLFPNLNDEERRILCDLRIAQLCVELGANVLAWNGAESDRRRLDAAVARMEARYVEARVEFSERRLLQQLSPFQKEIVEGYLSISFDTLNSDFKSLLHSIPLIAEQ